MLFNCGTAKSEESRKMEQVHSTSLINDEEKLQCMRSSAHACSRRWWLTTSLLSIIPVFHCGWPSMYHWPSPSVYHWPSSIILYIQHILRTRLIAHSRVDLAADHPDVTTLYHIKDVQDTRTKCRREGVAQWSSGREKMTAWCGVDNCKA